MIDSSRIVLGEINGGRVASLTSRHVVGDRVEFYRGISSTRRYLKLDSFGKIDFYFLLVKWGSQFYILSLVYRVIINDHLSAHRQY